MGGTEPLSGAKPTNHVQYSTFEPQSTGQPSAAAGTSQAIQRDLNAVRSASHGSTASGNFLSSITQRVFGTKASSLCTPDSSAAEKAAARARGAAAFARLPPVYQVPATVPASASPASRPAAMGDLLTVAEANRYEAWFYLIDREAGPGDTMAPPKLAAFANAIDLLQEDHRPPAAEFVISYLHNFYVAIGKPGELATYVGQIFSGMKQRASATPLIEAFFRQTATVFGNKQHLVAWGIQRNLTGFSTADADKLWRATAIWKLEYMRAEQRYDGWTKAFDRLDRQSIASTTADIALHANAITLIPEGENRHLAASQLAKRLIESATPRATPAARIAFVHEGLAMIDDNAVRAVVAEGLIEHARADRSAAQEYVHRAISDRFDLFDPGAGFHLRSVLKRLNPSAQSEKP
ncbi:hypothetical protein DBA20_26770 [Pandoraea capi]|nr:hypothetical protein [Pandoraea sp. LA3]MDN4586595.1 hypothetical protein [Pandoraea capi]